MGDEEARSGQRLLQLRARLAESGLAGFVVPRADEHQGEYVAPCAERLRWLTGFGGSAGRAIVLEDSAALFVDGRYTLEAKDSAPAFAMRHFLAEPPAAFLAEARPSKGAALGFDPWHSTRDQAQALAGSLNPLAAELRAVSSNPIDELWHDRPSPPDGPAHLHPQSLAGCPSADKRAALAEALEPDDDGGQGADWVLLSLPDSIAWLLNARGNDLPHVPLVLSFAAANRAGEVVWFVEPSRVSPELAAELGDAVSFRPPTELPTFLRGLRGKRVRLDPLTAPEACFRLLEEAGATIVEGVDPCQLPKACKNATELQCIREAHLSDGIALTRFLAWLEGAVPAGGVSELSAARRLAEFRGERPDYIAPSFDTISSSGPNAAINHYRVSEASSRPLSGQEVYLVDSGGQYPGGTTDVTRTLWFGDTPPEELRHRFTLVLKGHIALASARFPLGTEGERLDPLARQFLWREGLDYDHGTGHGVGSYLSVHEGPQRISRGGREPLRAGMVVSNEPGYYLGGAYGIRIENLVAVREAEGAAGSLEFENLTLAPIQRALVDESLLGADERAFLNAYQARVCAELSPALPADTAAWLGQATKPI